MKKFLRIKDKLPRTQAGFLMVEVLIATSIIVASILAAMAVTERSISAGRQTVHTAQASFLLEEGAEAVKILRDNAWTNISTLTAGTVYYPAFSSSWSLSATPSQVGIFTRTVVMSNVNRDASTNDISAVGVDDPRTKLFTVTVSWPEKGTTVTKTLSFYLIDIFS